MKFNVVNAKHHPNVIKSSAAPVAFLHVAAKSVVAWDTGLVYGEDKHIATLMSHNMYKHACMQWVGHAGENSRYVTYYVCIRASYNFTIKNLHFRTNTHHDSILSSIGVSNPVTDQVRPASIENPAQSLILCLALTLDRSRGGACIA